MTTKLPQNSLILVTGVNGYVGSHICNALLQAGFRVRGTVRNLERTSWIKKYMDEKHGADRLEIAIVPDITTPGCFDEVVRGIDSFAHVASDLSMNPDPAHTVTPIVNSVLEALRAANREKSCKSFVLTSSSAATATAHANEPYHVDKDTWNQAAITEAFQEPHENTRSKRWAAYGASKAMGEQAAWKYMRENNPQFTFNSVLPCCIFGSILDPQNQGGSAAAWIRYMYKPDMFQMLINGVSPQWFVHIDDVVKLHVACLTDLSVNRERVLAFSEQFTWNGILSTLRRLTPDESLPDDLAKVDKDLGEVSVVDRQRSLQILKDHYGQTEWLSLERGLEDVVASVF